MKTTEKQAMVEPKVVNPSIYIMDVNMAITKNKVTKEQVFKDKEPIKRSLMLAGKRSKDYNNLFSRLYRRCK